MYAGICTLIFFSLLGFYFMLKAMNYNAAAQQQVSFSAVNRLVGVGIGFLLVILGNIMPKMRRNSFFGLRTKWSMANNSVWQRSQRFGGISSVIAGFCIIIISLFINGVWKIVLLTCVITIWVVLCVVASRRYYIEDKNKSETVI